ncbi:hypothetical protein NP493_1547g00041 [Ridgeia piscesae]|uniref:Uncharacterized protein n=1 Tax=Ridgeia piscesae TaxID=27915 RepID=A0AAD9JZB5_RIDPI|nr:hypothetical protein NP493_1547g00041 [Ridgeia piscesae]
MLDRGPPVTKSGKLTLRWAGWNDSLAGIKLYALAVYKMKMFGSELTHNGETALARETLDANTQLYNTTIIEPGRFANVFHDTHKFLSKRAANSPPIDPGYEELTGQPPDTISREAIPNVNGIVKYEVSHSVDHDGGCSLNSPDSWSNVDDFQSEQILLDIPRADGDSVRVWVRATDVMGNTKTDSVLVHVDSSPPVIQDVRVSGTNSSDTLQIT